MKGLYDPNTGGESVGALASYNDLEALHELGKLVLDASYPHREVAVRSFAVTAGLWQEAAEPYWLALMADETIDVVDHCLRHIESDHPTNAATLLAPLRADDDPGVRERAEWAYTYFVEQGDSGGREGIEIRVALGREEYAYDDDITLTVTLVNSGEIPASVNTSLFYSPNHIPEHLKLELVTPDGNVYTYPNHATAYPRRSTYRAIAVPRSQACTGSPSPTGAWLTSYRARTWSACRRSSFRTR